MSNKFYNYSGAFIPGILARAEAETTEFQSVQAGFALLDIQGVDSGVADAYVVTTNGAPSGSYADGQIVEFKPLNANTGIAATININSVGVAALTLSTGLQLVPGALLANVWYRFVYNSVFGAFTLIAPSSTVITSNTISGAAPTHLVGLTPAGGSSTACTPIDATYALDQSITPTWTGAHVFSNAVAFNAGVTFATGLSLAGASAAYALTLTGNVATGNSLGLAINAGTNASDFALLVSSQSGGTQFFSINGQGSVVVGGATGGAKGVGTINAVALYVNGAAVLTSSATSANPTATVGLSAVNGVAATFMTSDSAPPLSQAIAPTWTADHIFSPASGVAITINGAVNRAGIVINGTTNTVNSFLMSLLAGSASGKSSGLFVQAGTSSADTALVVTNAANTLNFLELFGDGSGSLGASATLGLQWTNAGLVTVNAATTPLTVKLSGTSVFQVNGKTGPTIQAWGPTAAALVDLTPDSGTFTGTLHTNGAAPTLTMSWVRVGNMVSLTNNTGTSGTTTALGNVTITGLPAAIQPARTVNPASSVLVLNKSNTACGAATISGGTVTLQPLTIVGADVQIGSFGTGVSGYPAGNVLTYPLN